MHAYLTCDVGEGRSKMKQDEFCRRIKPRGARHGVGLGLARKLGMGKNWVRLGVRPVSGAGGDGPSVAVAAKKKGGWRGSSFFALVAVGGTSPDRPGRLQIHPQATRVATSAPPGYPPQHRCSTPNDNMPAMR